MSLHQPKAQTFNYISSAAGSGKTEWAIRFSQQQNDRGFNVIIVVPTKALADSYAKRSNGDIRSIHTGNTEEVSVTADIHEIFRKQALSAVPAISIAITESAFNLLKIRHGSENWCLIKDEAIEPLTIHTIRCSDSKPFIEQWYEFHPIDPRFDALRRPFKIHSGLQLEDETDDILKPLYALQQYLDDPYLEVLVDIERLNWDNPELRYSVYVKPEIYQDFGACYFLAANFEHTFLYHMYQKSGVNWVEHKPKTAMPKYAPSSRVNIHYWHENGNWSKSRRQKCHQNSNKTVLDQYLSWFKTQEPLKDYVYVANNAEKVDLDGVRMPAVCHGLNNWGHFTKFMSCASYLINRSDEQIYQYYGVSTSDARALRNTQMFYQQLMRTDVRNYQSTKPVDIYVPTYTEARELLMYLPEASIQDCKKQASGQKTGITGKLKATWSCGDAALINQTPASNQVRIAFGRNTFETKVINIDFSSELELSKAISNPIISAGFGLNNKPYYDPSNVALITQKKSAGAPITSGNQFLRLIIARSKDTSLHGLSKTAIKQKKLNDMPFFCTGQFPDGSGFKQNDCVGNNNLIAFDLDNSDITDKQIKRLFLGCEMLIYTTPSHDVSANLRRLRVVVVCNRTMSLSEHKKLMDLYSKRLMAVSITHGLDTTKLTPWSKFYLPHKESIKNHIKREKHLLDIDAVLARLPKEPKVMAPSIDDLKFSYPITYVATGSNAEDRCRAEMSQMGKGKRSNPAVKVGGIAGKANFSPAVKQQLYEELVLRGVDKSALKKFREYAKMT